ALAMSVETIKPEWRDPEYGYRLKQLRQWRLEAPDRPLVVVFGSSRTQMGICPAAMGFPDRPGSPVVYNFGYPAGHPGRAWLQFMRLVDAGAKPDIVLFQLAYLELSGPVSGILVPQSWGSRMNAGDCERLAALGSVPAARFGEWASARIGSWSESRGL